MTMKKITYLATFGATLCIALLVFVFTRQTPKITHKSLNSNATSNTNTQKVWGSEKDLRTSTVESLPGYTKYVSEKYGFSLELEKSFSMTHFPGGEKVAYAARFSRQNLNTGIERNRDTLVGFNPNPSDEIVLEVYPNDNNLTNFDSQSQATILDQYMWDRGVLASDVVTLNGQQVFRTVQRDTDAWPYGYYYLFITPKYLISFGSADISDADMQKALTSFSH